MNNNNNILEINDNKIQNIPNPNYNLSNNKPNNDNEGLPILSSLEISSSSCSVEDFYKKYYPEYKIIKFRNHIFIKMGKLITFSFDKNNNYIPKYSIGPHWYLTFVLLLLILSLVCLLYFTIFKRVVIEKQIIFFIFVASVYYFVLCAALIHPKVVMNKQKNFTDYGFCTFCKAYFNPYNKVEHCGDCGVCFENMDHHCIWMGKCVAKNNTFYFYAMIADIAVFYGYIIYCVVMLAIEKRNKEKLL